MRTGPLGLQEFEMNRHLGNNWGFEELEIEVDLLMTGKLGLRRAGGTYPDGTSFSMPDSDPLPEPLDVPVDMRDQIVVLALHRDRASRNVVPKDPASNTSGAKTEEITRGSALHLVPVDEMESLSQPSMDGIRGELREFMLIPVAQIVECRPDRRLILEDRFIPTVLTCDAAPQLAIFLRELTGLLHQRGEGLAARVGRGVAAENSDFLMLQTINRYEPAVAHLAAMHCHPAELYRLLIEIVSELSTLSAKGRRSEPFREYRHYDLRATFEPVIQAVRSFLSVILGQNAIQIPLAQRNFGISVAIIADRSLFDAASFVLAVRADIPREELRRRFPRQLKIGPVEQIRDLANGQWPGISMTPMSVAPREVPFHSGFVYFKLDRTGELWRKLKAGGGIAFHQVGEFPGLMLELWAIRAGLMNIPPDDLFGPGDAAMLQPRPDLRQVDAAHAPPASLASTPATTDLPEMHVDENLQFTVYRPKQLRALTWQPFLAFAHLSERAADAAASEPDPIEEVATQAEAVLGQSLNDYRALIQPTRQAVARESQLTFIPVVHGLKFDPPQHSFQWKGVVHRALFLVRAGPESVGKTLRGRLSVFLGSIVIAEVPLGLIVTAQSGSDPDGQLIPTNPTARFRKIFASYSHRDHEIVEEFRRYARVLGDEYLQDVVSLRSGDVWDTRLKQLITDADIFQLFWSWNSMDSKFVRAEWEHAIGLGRPEFIRPLYWEDPLPCRPEAGLPPEVLQRVHFQWLPSRGVAPATFGTTDLDPLIAMGRKDSQIHARFPSESAPPAEIPISVQKTQSSMPSPRSAMSSKRPVAVIAALIVLVVLILTVMWVIHRAP
jgi:type VI secretion system protein ImpJ